MRFAYNIITYLLSPVYGLYWLFRGVSNKSYRERLGQRFGFGYPQLKTGCIWIHAVSVGEVQASAPLVKALAKRFPDNEDIGIDENCFSPRKQTHQTTPSLSLSGVNTGNFSMWSDSGSCASS